VGADVRVFRLITEESSWFIPVNDAGEAECDVPEAMIVEEM